MKKTYPLLSLILVLYCALLGCDSPDSSSTSRKKPDSSPIEKPPEPIRIDTPPPPPILRSNPGAASETNSLSPAFPNRATLEEEGAVFLKNSTVDLSSCQQVNSVLDQLSVVAEAKRIIIAGQNTDKTTFDLLARLRSVERLDIPNVELSDDSAARLASMPRLSFLNFPGAQLPVEAVQQLVRSQSLTQLRCAESSIDDQSLEYLASLSKLAAVDLSNCKSVSAEGIAHLSACPRLKFLKLAGDSIDDNALQTIRNIKSLRILGLNNAAISDDGMRQLGSLNLSEIQLFQSPIGDASVKVLSEMSNLTTANLRGTKISDTALQHLTACRKLKKLEVSECDQPGITDRGCEELAKIKSLENINLWLSKITDAGLEPLVSLPKLTSLNLDNTAITDEGTKTIAKMKGLTWLHLGKTKITDACVPTLKSMTKLTFLDITTTALSAEASQEIADALEPGGCEVKR